MVCRSSRTLVVFFTLIAYSFGRSPYIRCFQRNMRHSIDNSQPIVELFYVRPYDCLNQCIVITNNAVHSEGLCRSVVYNHLQHSCRLYDHDGRKVPAILHPANGYDYFRFFAKKKLLPSGHNMSGKYPVKSLMEDEQPKQDGKRRFGNKRPELSDASDRMPEPVFPEVFSAPNNDLLRSNSGHLSKNSLNAITSTEAHFLSEEVKNLDETLASRDKGTAPVDADIFSAFSEGVSANKEVVHPKTTSRAPMVAVLSTAVPTKSTDSISSIATTSNPPYLASEKSSSDYPLEAEQVTARTMLKTTAEKPRNRFQLRPESSAGLPKGTKENVHLPNSASELGYESEHRSGGGGIANGGSDSKSGMIESEKGSFLTTSTTTPTPSPTSTTVEDVDVPSSTAYPKTNERKTCRTSTAYYVVIGNEIILPITGSESDVTIFHGVEQANCAKYCSSNMGPKGEPLKCSSINYFPITQKCEIYGIMAEPHGPGNLVENDEVIYAEKFCVPAHQGVQCQLDEIFILHVQKKIGGEAIRSVPSNSIAICLQACLNTKKCRSSSFDSNKGECILHKTSIADNSEKLEDSDPGWVLIENGCSATRRHHPSSSRRPLKLAKSYGAENKKLQTNKGSSEWSEWSECRYKVGSSQRVRVRTRNCEEQCPNGGMQIKKC